MFGEDSGHPLSPSLRAWVASPPFLAFARINAGKLRKKLREARTPDQQAAVQAELLVAAWLLRGVLTAPHHPSPLVPSPLVYEPLRAAGGRGPDFGLRLPDGRTLYAEVARLHATAQAPDYKLARVLAGKLGQLPPGAPGVLAVVLPGELLARAPAHGLVPAALRHLARAAQAEGEGGEALPGLSAERARAFQRGQGRLSGVLLLAVTGEGPDVPAVTLWTPAGAAHPLSGAALRALRGGGS